VQLGVAAKYNPIDPVCHAHCYEWYEELREKAPVYRTEAGAFVISRYEDVQSALLNYDVFSSQAMQSDMMGMVTDPTDDQLAAMQFLVEGLPVSIEELAAARMFIAADPPQHTAMRRVAGRGFRPRRIEQWKAVITELVDAHMGRIDLSQPFDVVDALARPVPAATIADVCSVEQDRMNEFKSWMDGYLEAAQGPDAGTPDAQQRLLGYFRNLIQYLVPRIEDRRRAPKDDLISDIVRAEDSGSMSTGDALFTLFILVGGGVSTTQHLIATTVMALLENPDQLGWLVEHPEALPTAIEEAIRYRSPVQMLWRDSVVDCTVAGVDIPAHSKVALLIGSANHDPRQFDDPGRYLISRANVSTHLGFGRGHHLCIGAALGRLVSRVALESLVPTLQHFEIEPDSLELTPASFLWGLERLVLAPRVLTPTA
jgi:cytochrome P450